MNKPLTTDALRKVYVAAPIITEANRLPDADVISNTERFELWLAERDRQTAERAHDEGFMEALDYYRVDEHVSDGPKMNPYRASEERPPMCSECGAPLSLCGCLSSRAGDS